MNTDRLLTAEKLESFVAALQAKQDADGRGLVVSAMRGPKYTRIVTERPGDEFSRSVFCFLDNATGAILKADGWKKPAKHNRGTVHTATHGLEFLGQYGAAYLR